MAWLVVRVKGQDRAFEIDEGVAFVGVGGGVLLRIPREGVIDHHCQILQTGNNYELIDLGSDLGTLLNGKRVERSALRNGDVIGVGGIAIRFRTKQAETTQPPIAPKQPAATTSRSTARGATRRAGSARRRGAAAGAGEDRIVRKKLRESRGLPTPYVIAVVAFSVVASIMLIMHFAGKSSIDVDKSIAKANDALDVGKLDEAASILKGILDNIDEDHHHFKYVTNLYIQATTQTKDLIDMHHAANMVAAYESNLKPFYEKWIDTEDEQYKDDPTTARYFVEYRCLPFLEEYPESTNCGTVRTWVDKLKARYDESKPFPESWWDHEVISAMEQRLENYGEAYVVLSSYQDKHPDAKTCKAQLADCLHRAREVTFKYYDERLQMAVDADPKPNFSRAMAWIDKAWENLRQIPDLRVKIDERVTSLDALAKEHNVKIDLSKYR